MDKIALQILQHKKPCPSSKPKEILRLAKAIQGVFVITLFKVADSHPCTFRTARSHLKLGDLPFAWKDLSPQSFFW